MGIKGDVSQMSTRDLTAGPVKKHRFCAISKQEKIFIKWSLDLVVEIKASPKTIYQLVPSSDPFKGLMQPGAHNNSPVMMLMHSL